MRICIWHGYHLRGTGSNVYVRNVAAEAVSAGHRVSLFCQEDDPVSLPFVDRAYDLDDTNNTLIPLEVSSEAGDPRCTVYRPNLAGHLPVYVYDKYDRFPRVTEMPDLDDEEIEDYIRRNVTALRTVFSDTPPDLVMTNHAVLSPEIARRAFGDKVHRVSVLHGSALNYSVKNDPRMRHLAVSGLQGASSIVVVSEGSGEKAKEILGGDLPELEERLKVVPCGVDTELFKILPVDAAICSLENALSGETGLAAGREVGPAKANELVAVTDSARGTYNERLPDERAFDKIMELDPTRPGLLVYTGKLIVSKGVHALLLALPELIAKTDARLLVVGFGTYREGLTLLLHALARGDYEALSAIATLGRRLEGGEEAPLPEMVSFLDSPDTDKYLETARTCGLLERVRFTGILEHEALCRVHAMADLAVVPSIFPEAFGMVGVEAMACGALPIMTRQGGLADLIELLNEEIDCDIAIDPSPELMVQSIIRAVPAALDLVRQRPGLRSELSRIATERFGWGSVAEGLLTDSH